MNVNEQFVAELSLQAHPPPECPPRPITIDLLEGSALQHIFEYFSCPELIILSCVCRKWCSTISGMAKSALFHRSTQREEIMRVLCSFPNSMETISLTGISGDIAVIMRELCNNQKHLKNLYIDSCDIHKANSKSSAMRLKNLLLSCKELQIISLKNISFEVKQLLPVFPQLENLRTLAIGNNPHLVPNDLVTIVLNCFNLDSLHLYHIENLCDSDIQLMLCCRGLNQRLKALTLDRVSELDSMSYDYILSCKSLETLRISNSYQLSAATVLKIPESLTSLKSLTFDEVFSVDTNTLQALFTGSNLRLNEFGLTERKYSNSFSDENLTALANCMHTTLVSLKLKNCMNLRNVMPLFEHCKFLKYLDLTDCSCIKVPAWLVPVGPAIILPQSLSSIQLRDNLNFDSAITMDSHLFSYKTDKSIYNSEENIF